MASVSAMRAPNTKEAWSDDLFSEYIHAELLLQKDTSAAPGSTATVTATTTTQPPASTRSSIRSSSPRAASPAASDALLDEHLATSASPGLAKSAGKEPTRLDPGGPRNVAGPHPCRARHPDMLDAIALPARSDVSARATRFNSSPGLLGQSPEAPLHTPQKAAAAPSAACSGTSPPVPQDSFTFGSHHSCSASSPAPCRITKPPSHPRRHCSPRCLSDMAQPMFSRSHSRDVWAHRLEASAEKFGMHLSPTGPLSPPSSAKLYQWDDAAFLSNLGASAAANGGVAGFTGMAHRALSYPQHMGGCGPLDSPMTPGPSPSLDRNNSQGLSGFGGGHQHPQLSFAADPFHPDHRSALASPDFDAGWEPDQFTFQSQPPSATPSTGYFDDQKVQPWWPTNGHLSSDTSRACSVNDQHAELLGDSSGFAANGLLISCLPGSADSGAGAAGTATTTSLRGGSGRALSADMASATPPVGLGFGFDVSMEPSCHAGHASTGSFSHSPTDGAGAVCGGDGGPGARRERFASSSSSSSSASHHRRSKTTGSKSSVGFVNFTPCDSKKILTGVAPSGSSKTKARREKEAAERRRKLEMAAARAVMEAGGDISALEREGLLD